MCRSVYEYCYEQNGWIFCIWKGCIIAWLDLLIFATIVANLILMGRIKDKGWSEWCYFMAILGTAALAWRCCCRAPLETTIAIDFDIEATETIPSEDSPQPVSLAPLDPSASSDSFY